MRRALLSLPVLIMGRGLGTSSSSSNQSGPSRQNPGSDKFPDSAQGGSKLTQDPAQAETKGRGVLDGAGEKRSDSNNPTEMKGQEGFAKRSDSNNPTDMKGQEGFDRAGAKNADGKIPGQMKGGSNEEFGRAGAKSGDDNNPTKAKQN